MRLGIAAVLIVAPLALGCAKKTHSADPPAPSPEEVARDQAKADHDAAALASYDSMPPADWPCTRTISADDAAVTDTFTYGAMQQCRLPIDEVIAGVTGCPTEMHRVTTISGTTKTSIVTFHYDGDRLTQGDTDYHWRADGLYSGPDGTALVQIARGLRADSKYASLEYQLDHGRPVVALVSGSLATMFTKLQRTIAWNGDRVTSIVGSDGPGDTAPVTTTLTYDCGAAATATVTAPR